MADKKFCWSIEEEGPFRGKFDTREEALKEAIGELEGLDMELPRDVWTGVNQAVSLSDFTSAETIMEQAYEQAYDEIGEVVEDWAKPNEAASRDLKVLLDRWSLSHDLQPKFWRVDEVESHTIERF